MTGALELAAQGTALASPNPLVGALLVKDGQIAGQGYYKYEGKKHAEVKALEQAGEAARGATLYINLEPCCHVGRTGPCTSAILAAGVKRVVAAMIDPNPLVSGRGFEQLRKAGVEVETGLCRERAEQLNESFARYIRTGLPLVTLKVAMTLDGKIAAPDDNSGWITSDEARSYVQQQRRAHDAILTGVGTVVADDPLLTDRSGLPRRRPLLRVVMDSRLRIPLDSRMLSRVDGDLLVFCSSSIGSGTQSGIGSGPYSERRRELERRGVQVCQVEATNQDSESAPIPTEGKERVGCQEKSDAGSDLRPDLVQVMKELGRREITSVLVEAGSELNWAILQANLADKVFLYYAPKILGGLDALPMAGGRGIRAMRDALTVNKIQLHQFGPDFAVEGYLHDVYRTVTSDPGAPGTVEMNRAIPN